MVEQTVRLNPDVITRVTHYKKILSRAHVPYSRIIIFGSQAKGNARIDSDIDVAVVSPQFGKDYFDELGDLIKLRNLDTIDIEPHPFHPDDLNDRWNSLSQEIKKNGIEV